MSRHLPARPNLDHLKKQAKDLLGDLERRNPSAKLADALHAIAREYGFINWPTLKAHVESLPHDAEPVFAESTAQDSPFVGQWAANLSKSKRHPANQFQSATIELAVDGATVTINDSFVDASGREAHSTHTIEADGIEHLSGNGYGLVAGWRGSRVLETVATKDGQVVGRGTYEISTDGMTLTISAPEQVIVLDRLDRTRS